MDIAINVKRGQVDQGRAAADHQPDGRAARGFLPTSTHIHTFETIYLHIFLYTYMEIKKCSSSGNLRQTTLEQGPEKPDTDVDASGPESAASVCLSE